jgi:hypothetical protein
MSRYICSNPRRLCQAGDGRVVETEVEDRVHHSRHRNRRSGADADQQWFARTAETAPDDLLDFGDVGANLGVETLGPATVEVGAARFGGDDKTGWHREAEFGGHHAEVGALAAEQGPDLV